MRLPAIVGFGRAMELILTGRPINAKEAYEWGLANQLVAVGTGEKVEDGSGSKCCVCVSSVHWRFIYNLFFVPLAAVGGAYNLAQSLVKFPQECMLADRRSALHATFSSSSIQEALKFEHDNGVPVIAKVSTIFTWF